MTNRKLVRAIRSAMDPNDANRGELRRMVRVVRQLPDSTIRSISDRHHLSGLRWLTVCMSYSTFRFLIRDNHHATL